MQSFPSSLVSLPFLFQQLQSVQGVIAVSAPQRELQVPLGDTLITLAGQNRRVAIVLANNDFDVYAIARLAKQHGFEPRPLLRRIELTRAETVHQVWRCFQRLAASPAGLAAVFALGLLEPFQDQDIPWTDAQRLLGDTLEALKNLSTQQVKVLITLPPLKHSTRPYLTQQLARGVDTYIEFTPPLSLPDPIQLRLL